MSLLWLLTKLKPPFSWRRMLYNKSENQNRDNSINPIETIISNPFITLSGSALNIWLIISNRIVCSKEGVGSLTYSFLLCISKFKCFSVQINKATPHNKIIVAAKIIYILEFFSLASYDRNAPISWKRNKSNS